MAKRIIGKQVSRQVVQRDISRLRKSGLISKGQGTTAKSRIFLRRKYKDVLTGRAAAVKVPRSEVGRFKRAFKVKGSTVIVPRTKGERVSVDSSGRITTTREVGGKRVKRIIHAGGKMPKPRKGKKFMYAVPFTGGGRVRFESLKDLQAFMQPYQDKSYSNWQQYMEIEEVDDDLGLDEYLYGEE